MERMEKNRFSIDYRVPYSDVTSGRKIRADKLVDCFQTIAIAHSDAVGYDLEFFDESGLGWIMTYWHVRIFEKPYEGDNILLSTWCIPHKRVQAFRDFSMEDEKGRELAHGSSKWAMMDTVKRRPARIKREFYDAYAFEEENPMMDIDFDTPQPEGEPESSVVFPVTRRDTDTNDHTNNIAYITWAMDEVVDDIYDRGEVTDIWVEYKKECRRGTRVRSFNYSREYESEAGKVKIQTDSVFRDAGSGKMLAHVCVEWKA